MIQQLSPTAHESECEYNFLLGLLLSKPLNLDGDQGLIESVFQLSGIVPNIN